MSTTDEADVHGPIDFLLLEFDPDKMTGEAADALLDLVEGGIVQIYDLLVIVKDDDGSVRGIALSDATQDGLGSFAAFEGAGSGLIGDSDIAEAGNAMLPGTAAALLVYENTWAAPFAAAARKADAQVIASARIPADVLAEVLDELES